MSLYEVVVSVMNHGKELGRTVVRLRASSRFDAAIRAESSIEGSYGESSYGHFVKVEPLSEAEFSALAVA